MKPYEYIIYYIDSKNRHHGDPARVEGVHPESGIIAQGTLLAKSGDDAKTKALIDASKTTELSRYRNASGSLEVAVRPFRGF